MGFEFREGFCISECVLLRVFPEQWVQESSKNPVKAVNPFPR